MRELSYTVYYCIIAGCCAAVPQNSRRSTAFFHIASVARRLQNASRVATLKRSCFFSNAIFFGAFYIPSIRSRQTPSRLVIYVDTIARLAYFVAALHLPRSHRQSTCQTPQVFWFRFMSPRYFVFGGLKRLAKVGCVFFISGSSPSFVAQHTRFFKDFLK